MQRTRLPVEETPPLRTLKWTESDSHNPDQSEDHCDQPHDVNKETDTDKE